MIRASAILVAAILSASALVTVNAQDDTVVRVDYVAVLVQADGTESPYSEGVHYIASDGRHRHDQTPADGTPTSEYRLPRDGVHVSVNHDLLEAVRSRTRSPRQRRVARRTRLRDAARRRRDDGDRREDAGSDPLAGSAGSRGPRAYRVLGVRPAHDGGCRGSARVSADRHRGDHLHGHRRALRGSSDFGSTHSARAGPLHGSRSCPLSGTVPPTLGWSPCRTAYVPGERAGADPHPAPGCPEAG